MLVRIVSAEEQVARELMCVIEKTYPSVSQGIENFKANDVTCCTFFMLASALAFAIHHWSA